MELPFAEMSMDFLRRNVRAEVAKFFFFSLILCFSPFLGGGWMRASTGVGRQTPGTHVLLEILITILTVQSFCSYIVWEMGE